MKTAFAVLTLLLIGISDVGADEMRYELYKREDGKRELVASGVRSYSATDFHLSREERGGRFYGTRKVLELHGGFGVGVLETYDSAKGFGLNVEHLPLGSNPNDFSWEWYDPASGSEYRKRQGGTRVDVFFLGQPATSEIQTVRFVENAEFEYTVDICCKDSDGGPTHVLRILSGSVLEFPR